MKPVRWSPHAIDNLADREIDRAAAEKTLANPEFVVPGQLPRLVLMRRYFDQVLQQEMLLRMVVEDTLTERIVITVYKTSQIAKYLKGLGP
jgi:nitrate reductase beta subunit